MKKVLCVLFDMDGVMIDTEPQYDKFWKHAAARYSIGIPNFEKVIKGTTLPNILKKYFSEYTKAEVDAIVRDIDDFESKMQYPEIPGSVKFVQHLKDAGVKVGLVTSSTETKLVGVNREMHFDQLFDTTVSAAHIKNGKPHPECFLLAAKRLNVNPADCIVFEDSFAGVEAGLAAGMTVIGLSTTHHEDEIAKKGVKVIPDFSDFTLADLEKFLD